ncbi:WD40 repeat-like protein, partial [Auriscalpium vulgare]
LRIWNAQTGQPVSTPLVGHCGEVHSVMYSHNGEHIVSGGGDRLLRIWDGQTGQPVCAPLKGHNSAVHSVAYSPDGRHIVSASIYETCIWNVELIDQPVDTSLKEHCSSYSSDVLLVTYSPDGNHIISKYHDNSSQVWNAKTGELAKILKPHMGLLAQSPDRKHVISTSWNGNLQIWNIQTGQTVGTPLVGHPTMVNSAAYSHDGKYIVSVSLNDMHIWDALTGQSILERKVDHNGIQSLEYSPDHNYIVSGSRHKSVQVWNAQTGYCLGIPLEGHTDRVDSVAYSPDGEHIVSGSWDKTIRVWKAPKQQPQAVGTQNETYMIAFSPCAEHALNNPQALYDLHPSKDIHLSVTNDGWIVDLSSSPPALLMWLPPANRPPGLYTPGTHLIIGASQTILDLSKLAHGRNWTQCMKG